MIQISTVGALIFAFVASIFIPAITLLTGRALTKIERDRSQRESENLSTERRRLAEVNIGMQQELEVTQDRDRGYIVLRLPLVNLGDGPVDILGTLVSARALTSPEQIISTRSRDVGWADYQAYPWNYPEAGEPFCGISTTRYLTVSADQFPRLAVKEDIELLRIEAVKNIAALQDAGSRYFMFRIFLVARGYTLGEISRQLGGKPPDPLRTVRSELLQFQPLAQPDYFSWSQVQKALFNINRFVFRLATDDPDPLGRLCSPNAWRLFLLHHWDFIDEADVAPVHLAANPPYRCPLAFGTTKPLIKEVAQLYPNQVLPDNWWTDPQERVRYERTRELCRARLAPMLARWDALKQKIEEASAFQPMRSAGNAKHDKDQTANKEWYPNLIRTNPEYRDRWLALMEEGYLISAPQPRRGYLGKHFNADDIPPDPRILEPFVMRTRFFLAEARLGKRVSSTSVRFTTPIDSEIDESLG
jgi:hypothetical protein